jgi:predicted small lipoprotein YifL
MKKLVTAFGILALAFALSGCDKCGRWYSPAQQQSCNPAPR